MPAINSNKSTREIKVPRGQAKKESYRDDLPDQPVQQPGSNPVYSDPPTRLDLPTFPTSPISPQTVFFQNVTLPKADVFSASSKRVSIPRGVSYPVYYPDKMTYYGVVRNRGIPVDGGTLSTNYGGQAMVGRGGSFSIYTQRANDVMFYLDNVLLDTIRMTPETNRVYVELSVRNSMQRKQRYNRKR